VDRQCQAPGCTLNSHFNQDAILNQENAAYGIGKIILEAADELESIRTAIGGEPATADEDNSP
jgi:hypothetical protein